MDKLRQLLARCKCGVYLTINEHRDVYETVASRLNEYELLEGSPTIADDVRSGILASNTIIDLRFYPDTPVGFYWVVHYDLNKALDEALGLCGQG